MVILKVLFLVGLSFGNDLFVADYDIKLGDVIEWIWYYFDFVFYVWEEDVLEEIWIFYNLDIKIIVLINLFVNFVKKLSNVSGVIY